MQESKRPGCTFITFLVFGFFVKTTARSIYPYLNLVGVSTCFQYMSGVGCGGLMMWVEYERTGVAQLVSARPSKLEFPSSTLRDSNVCFDVLPIRVALALNTRKAEH